MLLIYCPQCPDVQQSTNVSNEKLKQMLASDEDITVMGMRCGHVWSLTAAQKESLRKEFAAGAL